MDSGAVLGAALVALRERKGWSQEEAAKRMGISRVTLGTWERGEAKPRPDAIQRAADVYGATPEQLVTGHLPGAPVFDPASFEAGRQSVLVQLFAFMRRLGLPDDAFGELPPAELVPDVRTPEERGAPVTPLAASRGSGAGAARKRAGSG